MNHKFYGGPFGLGLGYVLGKALQLLESYVRRAAQRDAASQPCSY